MQTKNLGLVTYLKYPGNDLEYTIISNGRQKEFIFEDEDKANELKENYYHKRGQVDSLTFMQVYKSLKSEMEEVNSNGGN